MWQNCPAIPLLAQSPGPWLLMTGVLCKYDLKIMEHQTFDVLTKFPSFGLFVGQGGASHKRIKANVTCLDPEFLCWGGRGGPEPTARKQP